MNNRRIAILIECGFEQMEVTESRKALENIGVGVHLVSPSHPFVQAWNNTDWGDRFSVDVSVDEAMPEDYQALLIPGGLHNELLVHPEEKTLAFILEFLKSGKPIATLRQDDLARLQAHLIDYLKEKNRRKSDRVQRSLQNHFQRLLHARPQLAW